MIYLKECYLHSNISGLDHFVNWECQFIIVAMLKKLISGNIYRPPRLYTVFTEEFT